MGASYEPPFRLTDSIVGRIVEIGALTGRASALDALPPNPRLRRENRIRTIHSSLAIENNTLSLDQVTAVLEGKRVLAPAKDILEVQNAFEAYEALDQMDPASIDDLLQAHKLMMQGLTADAGRFRSGNVGVFSGDKLIHPGTPARYVAETVGQLFEWLSCTSTHPLVRSCVFHYEFEFIHPFSDGNGRMGRLWHSLILQQWNPLFAWLPIESLVYENQQPYYDSLAKADAQGESTAFIEFMLEMVQEALQKMLNDEQINEQIYEQINPRLSALLALIARNPRITYAKAAEALEVSYATARRDFDALQEQGLVRREGSRKTGTWRIVDTASS